MRKAGLVLITFSLMAFFASISHGDEIYSVQKGDTLYNISKRFSISVEDLKKANNLDSIDIQIDQKLSIPSPNIPNKTYQDKFSATASKREARYHIVEKGDTLKKIALQYGLKQDELVALNNNIDSRRLRLGQKILLSSPSPSIRAKEPLEPNKAVERPPVLKTHVVKKGENLYQIASKYNLSLDELKEMNGLSDSKINRGQRLVVSRQDTTYSNNDNPVDSIRANYTKRKTPVVAQANISEVQELSKTEDLANLNLQERIILFAKKLLHLPYSFGGSGAFGIDCSAFVQKVYSAAGVKLPRSAREQYKVGETVDSKNELTKGDLVFFRTYASFPSHVGIYLGNNLFIHASTLSKKVTIDSLDTPYYVKRYIGAKRFLTEEEAKNLSTDPRLSEN